MAFFVCRTIIIYYSDDAVSSKILEFADDTKITVIISSIGEQNIIHTDLNKLKGWSEEW